MNKVCSGCGIILQSENELLPGFIPKNKYNESNYCKRCFRLTHYGDKNSEDIKKTTDAIIKKVNKDNILKIFLIDILNINNSTIELYNKINGKKMLLINKYDLIDNSINKDHIIKNIKKVYNIEEEIKYISAKNEYGINFLLYYLKQNKINKCYLLGPTNSGKSTLINTLIEKLGSKTNKLTVSNKRNTTLEFINIKLNDISILDSPGFLLEEYNRSSKYNKVIKPITFNMKKDEIINIDNFFIKFNSNTCITVFTYDKINIKKYYNNVEFDYNFDIKNNSDICINGFGFIRIKKSCKIEIYGINKNIINIRKSIIGE